MIQNKNQKATITDIAAYRAARRRAGNIRWVLILVFLVACMFGGYFFAISSFFSITQIQVEGSTTLDAQRIIELSNVQLGDNIFSVDRGRTVQRIQLEPRVKTVEISRRLPHTLLIQVTEREAVAYMLANGKLLALDETGQVLQRYESWSNLDLPLISGVDLLEYGSLPGVTIGGAGMEAALEILGALPEDAEDIGEINVANPQFIKLYTVSGIEVRLGDSRDFADKYLVYSSIIQDNRMEQAAPLAYIDVSIVSKPTLTYR